MRDIQSTKYFFIREAGGVGTELADVDWEVLRAPP
jgi:hypothetical protein